jgi:hypothetical protein
VERVVGRPLIAAVCPASNQPLFILGGLVDSLLGYRNTLLILLTIPLGMIIVYNRKSTFASSMEYIISIEIYGYKSGAELVEVEEL